MFSILFQALSSFSSALQSGQLGPLMTQFSLGEDVANAAAQGGKTLYEMSHDVRKPVFGVSDQLRLKPGFTVTEDS